MFRTVIETQLAGRTVRLTPEQFAGLRDRDHKIEDGPRLHGAATYTEANDLPLSVDAILSRIEDARWAWATAQWLPGNTTTRRFATTADARREARELLSDRDARKWNPSGVLIRPVGGDYGYWMAGFDEIEEG